MSTTEDATIPSTVEEPTLPPHQDKKKQDNTSEDGEDDDSGSGGSTVSSDDHEDNQDENDDDDNFKPPAPKKAKIAMPPAVASHLVDVDEYILDEPPPADSNQDDSKIDTPNIILFGLHPLVREPPLKKMCEHYGEIQSVSVRSAFASRYGHIEFASVQEAKAAYRALNGAKLLHKAILVQPTKSSPVVT
jgi:RNA recognition motif. (a.k.a. RRM, RBD, or RNP domain)